MQFPEYVLELPGWVETWLPEPGHVYPTVQERMHLAIELGRQNIGHETGGPFGAAIFDTQTWTLLAPGVNLVVPTHCSSAHAEIVAITIAQQVVRHFDLGNLGMPGYELVSSTEPCAMCMGAILWSGVRRLVCGARDEDAQRVGFDEGPKASDWVQAFASRGVAVVRDVCRQDAADLLVEYATHGGPIYNARQAEDAF